MPITCVFDPKTVISHMKANRVSCQTFLFTLNKKKPQTITFFYRKQQQIKEGSPEALGRAKQSYVAYITSLTKGAMFRMMVFQAEGMSTQYSANLGLFSASRQLASRETASSGVKLL